ncbi:MAG TPA: amidase [Rhodanobacteraceae bacterium]|nr:amidase [Rhodanobacteraceae bacterium]
MNAHAETAHRPADSALRRAGVCQTLHWLATGQVTPNALAEAYLAAAERRNAELNAFVELHPDMVREQADAATRRRAQGVIGRLDGIPVAVKDNLDMAGWPTRAGIPARGSKTARSDAHAVARLRAAGAVLMGKTLLDEGALGAAGDNPHYGPTKNPFRLDCTAGGSSCGSAAAVAAGLVAAALGSDSLGSVRIPASYCGLSAIKPTHGEISARGLIPAARRLDAVGVLARSPDDLAVMLQVLGGYDAEDPRSRKRRVALAIPDWEPGRLRSGVLGNLAAIGVEDAVIEVFDEAVARLNLELGQRHGVDFSDWNFSRTRRAGLLLMEAEMRHTFAAEVADAAALSPRFRAMLDFAASKNATDYVVADRVLDAAALKSRRLFAQIDVLILPTTPQGAFPLAGPAPDNQADLTGFASLAGCPAVSIPMGTFPDGLPIGMQFVGPPGSDLRLLELASVCAARLDAVPAFPVD